ncbi:nicotinic acid mononucleotide adenylyltransferase [Notoacmeibacter marinus]|uniref:Probable nicotinate-nucleotide adenylyltransferase n=1 Tax=Notoacmeibacter marinus TaxID=1876515 RepID=A0A231V2L8_9HYPH|nr:nicotinic acid mononucleotide adenylyltransferase [Notoacmeibacter marinus]
MRLIGTARDRPPVDLTGVHPNYLKMPKAPSGLAIGLFGGSFNPPHGGHALAADTAMRRLKLDRLWWMVTPGNPLKQRNELAPLAERIAQSEETAANPRIDVTAFEAVTGAGFTADTLAHIRRRNPTVHFVWIMGADSLAGFHRWQRWREIAETYPIAIIDRPGSTLAFLSSRMAKTFDHARIDEDDAALLPRLDPPAWTFIHGPRSALSSTEIRESRSTADQ